MEIDGYSDQPDWPKMGPSLLIATCLIVAIRTARWPAHVDPVSSEHDLGREIDYGAHIAATVLSALLSKKESLFPTKRVPWYMPSDEDVPK
jgi:hypothetical protein